MLARLQHRKTSPLYLFLFALMTTIMTDLKRTTLHCNIAASSECFCFLLLPFWTCVTRTRERGVLTMHSNALLVSTQTSTRNERRQCS